MANIDVDKLTNDGINKGGVLAILYFDLHSKNKDGLTQLSAGFVETIIKTPGVTYALGEIDEPIENKGIFSTSVEVKVLAKSFLDLVNLCSTYTPIAIEILRPNEIKLSLDKVHELLMSVSSNWFAMKKFVTERTSTKEDLEQYRKYLENRVSMGKKLLEEKKK
jgi:hypothetical protein